MELVLWMLCILVCILIITIIWLNKSFSKMFMKGVQVENKVKSASIINFEINKKYSNVKVYNIFLLGLTYLLAVFGMNVIYNLSGTNHEKWLEIIAFFAIIALIISFINVYKQFTLFKLIIYPLMDAAKSEEKYIDDVLKYRRNTYIGIVAQSFILLLLLLWMTLVSLYPDSVLVYPIPKLSIVVVFGYIVEFFVNDSNLDAIYWKYFMIDFRKFISEVFKKK
ncbi:hypothetical protein ACT5YT_08100 [Leuconostoc suionicum]|uniref:hypothetical protein n=1 Tax=Leuconostoc suionicum TaxID=1511761 RepID=UPI004034FE36